MAKNSKAFYANRRKLELRFAAFHKQSETIYKDIYDSLVQDVAYERHGVFGYMSMIEDFVDEDNGEVISITRKFKVTRHNKLCDDRGKYIEVSDLLKYKDARQFRLINHKLPIWL
jgi:hypothetical protein